MCVCVCECVGGGGGFDIVKHPLLQEHSVDKIMVIGPLENAEFDPRAFNHLIITALSGLPNQGTSLLVGVRARWFFHFCPTY